MGAGGRVDGWVCLCVHAGEWMEVWVGVHVDGLVDGLVSLIRVAQSAASGKPVKHTNKKRLDILSLTE